MSEESCEFMHAQGLKQLPAYCFLVCHDVLLLLMRGARLFC